MSTRPSAAELLEAVGEFLERDLLGGEDAEELTTRTRFHVRVAVNALAIVQRELELGPALDAVELQGLRALVGQAPFEPPDDRTELDELRASFAAAIRDGSLDDRRADVVDFVKQTLRGTLSISKPGYDIDEVDEA